MSSDWLNRFMQHSWTFQALIGWMDGDCVSIRTEAGSLSPADLADVSQAGEFCNGKNSPTCSSSSCPLRLSSCSVSLVRKLSNRVILNKKSKSHWNCVFVCMSNESGITTSVSVMRDLILIMIGLLWVIWFKLIKVIVHTKVKIQTHVVFGIGGYGCFSFWVLKRSIHELKFVPYYQWRYDKKKITLLDYY